MRSSLWEAVTVTRDAWLEAWPDVQAISDTRQLAEPTTMLALFRRACRAVGQPTLVVYDLEVSLRGDQGPQPCSLLQPKPVGRMGKGVIRAIEALLGGLGRRSYAVVAYAASR
jgi:hypothetical protein